MLVFSLGSSSLFCVPRLVFRLSILHLTLMLISPSFLVILIFISLTGHTLLGRVCVDLYSLSLLFFIVNDSCDYISLSLYIYIPVVMARG